MNKTLKITLIAFLLGLTTACSTMSVQERETQASAATLPGAEGSAWRNCTFRITWPKATDPDWAVDLLLAHQVVGPVLKARAHTLERWRFHRRASRDSAGHQFTFMYYTSAAQAEGISKAIRENTLLKDLLDKDILTLAHCQGPENVSRPEISDTSDPNWSETVQKNWPSYIMGVSQLWLGLIDDAIAAQGPAETDIDDLLVQYREANRLITETWQTEGRHAFLHHLNAIFGYEKTLLSF